MKPKFYEINGKGAFDDTNTHLMQKGGKFLMAKHQELWFFATQLGDVIYDDFIMAHAIYDNAVKRGFYKEVPWPVEWVPLSENAFLL